MREVLKSRVRNSGFLAAALGALIAFTCLGCNQRWMWRYPDGDPASASVATSIAANWQGYAVAGGMGVPGEWTWDWDDGILFQLWWDGNPIALRKYGWPGSDEHFEAIVPVAELSMNVIVAGQSDNPEFSAGVTDGWLSSVNMLTGKPSWSYFWGGAQNESFSSLTRTSDGGFVAVGGTTSYGSDMDVWVVKVGPDGSRLGEMRYDSGERETGVSISEIDTEEGKALLVTAERGEPGNADIWVLALDGNDLSVIWQTAVGGPQDDWLPEGIQVLDQESQPNGILVGGGTQNSSDTAWPQALVVKLTNDGEFEWARTYWGGSGFFQGQLHTVTRGEESSYIFGGFTTSPDAGDAWLLAVDADGNPLWSTAYGGWQGGENLEGRLSIGSLAGGGTLFAAGRTWSWDELGEAFAMVTDGSGSIPGCSLMSRRPAEMKDAPAIEAYQPEYLAEEIWSAIHPAKLAPDSLGGKGQQLCPLDCLYHADVASQSTMPDGKSWETAFPSLQEALAAAADEEPPETERCEVWVAEGTYRAYQSEVTDTFDVAERVHVLGGFPTGGGDILSRKWTTQQTVLTGEGEDEPKPRVHHVVTLADESMLDGLYIERGLAIGPGADEDIGGGVYSGGGSPAIRQCEIRQCCAVTKGAGAYFENGAPFVEHVTFRDNVPEVGGEWSCPLSIGGGSANWNAATTYRECSFEGNQARFGGGMATWMEDPAAGTPMVLDSTFTANRAEAGSALATYNAASTAPPFHVNLLVTGNQSTGWEGTGGTADGSIVTMGAGLSPSFVHCTVADNTGDLLTGGLQTVESNPLVVNSIFWGNHEGLVSEIYYGATSNPSVWYSDIEDGWSGTGAGNVSSDPLHGADYQLLTGSLCIDAAFDLPSLYPWTTEYVNHDLVPNPRPVGSGYDMGCYERQ